MTPLTEAELIRFISSQSESAAMAVAAIIVERDALKGDAELFRFWFGTGLLASQSLDWYREHITAAKEKPNG
jgi:hypothetical protein